MRAAEPRIRRVPTSRRPGVVPRTRLAFTASLPFVVACSSKPPADFAPDPELVDRITDVRIISEPFPVCPGDRIQASYEAVLDDGAIVPFATRYDDDDPPALHVVFLGRTSAEADPRDDGSWNTDPDPLTSVLSGYRLSAFLRAKPSLVAHEMIEPEYSCLRRVIAYRGPVGRRGQPGGPGPDITVRVDMVSSRFYERLVVAGIQVGVAPPFYVLGDFTDIPPADWITVESIGGRGGRGLDGADGVAGEPGAAGCPAGAGGAGGAGGNGGPGGPGGAGGHITIIVPDAEPLLAGLVDGYSSGGEGGDGGPGGTGGQGGEGGNGHSGNRRCVDGQPGANGADGAPGAAGPAGRAGPRARIVEVRREDVFGRTISRALRDLIDYHRNR